MNRRTILAGAFAIAAARAVGAVVPNINFKGQDAMGGQSMSAGMEDDTIGKLSEAEFMRLNEQGAATVSAVTPTSTPLSKSDQKLMMEVAMGGMMQLEVSRVAVQKATTEDARMLAEAEVAEQTGLKAKLTEIAAAKNITLPSAPDAKTRRMVAKMQGMSGVNFDRAYVNESGVKGHQLLDKTMSKVETRATDPSLKALAAAAHPLVRTHLQVSRDELAQMSGKGGSMGMGGNSNTRS